MKNFNKFHLSLDDGSYRSFEGDIVISDTLLQQLVDSFYKEVMSKLSKDSVVLFQVQISTEDHYYSLCKFQAIDQSVADTLKSLLTYNLNNLYSKYSDYPIRDIFIRWKLLAKDDPLAKVKLQGLEKNNKEFLDKLTEYKLPATMDLKKWEQELGEQGFIVSINKKMIKVFTSGSISFFVEVSRRRASKYNRKQIVEHQVTVLIGGGEQFSFVDKLIKKAKGSESFDRTLNNGAFIQYKDGKQISLQKPAKEVPYILDIPRDLEVNKNFWPLDLETRTLSNGDLEPISAVFYTLLYDAASGERGGGDSYYTYFLTDYISSPLLYEDSGMPCYSK
jgi:hypothetical protein